MTYVAFSDEARAFAFEKYLKSSSGRAFAKKRLVASSDHRLVLSDGSVTCLQRAEKPWKTATSA
jgi:hypothetical protein